MTLTLPLQLPALPLDDDARQTIRFELDRSLLVEAGAGTGKTTVLVRRVVELVARGRVGDVARLVAITFTEAAAAELRDRIRRALEHAAVDPSRPADERDRCNEAVRHIDEASITTIHGFAHRLLTEHAIDAALPPAFEVEEGVGASLAFAERWRRFCDDLFADADAADDLRLAFTLRIALARLRQVALAFHARWDRLVVLAFTPPPRPRLDPAVLVRDLARLDRLVEPRRHDRDDRLVRFILTEHLRLGEAIAEADDELDLVRAVDGARLTRPGNAGTAAVWGTDKDEALDTVRRVIDERTAQLNRLRTAVLERLVPRLAAFTLAGADERRRRGRVEFHDLLVFARDLLRHDAVVRNALNRRFDVICIDEFQDTDPIQLELAMLLALRDPAAPPPATLAEADLVEGKLLIVGDPKQSIYRFRGADIALWDQAQEAFQRRTVRLVQNFRSVPGIIDWVNHVFARLLGDGDGDAHDGNEAREGDAAGPGRDPRRQQVAYVPLAAARDRLSDQPAVVVVGAPADALAAEIRRVEADEVARLIRLVKDERWTIHDRDDRRPVRFADIALLVPTRTPLGELERALADQAVPYRVESRSLVWATEEVRTLLAILTAIDDPADEVAVIAALRSSAFACADPDLADYRLAGGRWDYLRSRPDSLPDDHPVAVAIDALRALHERRWWEPVNVLVERVIRERRMIELTMAERRPRDHWRRLRFVIDQARAFVEAGGGSLGAFVAWAVQQADEGAQVVEAVVPEPDDDAVRILTVHGAKGLEFPVVVLAGLNAGTDPFRPRVLWGEERPEIAFGAQRGARFETAGYAGLDTSARQAEAAESLRLLYVAATRARDHLVVCLHHRPGGNGVASHAERLWHVLAGAEGLFRTHDIPIQPSFSFDEPTGPPARLETPDERAAWLDQRAELLERSRRPRVVAATGLAALDDRSERDDESDEPADGVSAVDEQRRLGPGRRAGTAVGRAVHALLQAVDLDAIDDPATDGAMESSIDVDRLARSVAAGEGIADDAGVVAGLARSVLRSPTVVAARASPRRWRELYVAAPIGDRVLEGYVDLVFEDAAGRLIVVDYKTDRARSEAELDAAAARYRLQGAAYALALSTALGRPVDRCVFVFARTEGAVERSIVDLPAAIEEVLLLLA
ncbi:MAG: UvrD-helicase domain-containing protein [Acidimicrobiales bacterium]